MPSRTRSKSRSKSTTSSSLRGMNAWRNTCVFHTHNQTTHLTRPHTVRWNCSDNSFGDQCFAAAGPRLWNTLPVQLRHCDSIGQFKRLLKTYLFGDWDRGALWHLLGAPCINHLTYLHPIRPHTLWDDYTAHETVIINLTTTAVMNDSWRLVQRLPTWHSLSTSQH